MFIAGEASGDALGAALVGALREAVTRPRNTPGVHNRLPDANSEPIFFGVSGPQMQTAGVETIFDFSRNAVFGLDALLRLWEFRRCFKHLLRLAIEREPEAIVCVDFSGFNLRFAHAVKQHLRARRRSGNWNPKIIQYVSPQVWASRPRRAVRLAEDVDLLLTIFPFEKDWYAERTPSLRVAFVGHPMVDRYKDSPKKKEESTALDSPRLVLLPGSRPPELKRHLPVMKEALRLIRAEVPRLRTVMVLSERIATLAGQLGLPEGVEIRSNLEDALSQADLALAKSGTVTLECAYFGVPTVVMYKASAATYEIARRIVKLNWIAMPNILANDTVFPEFIQQEATATNLARAVLELLRDPARRTTVKAQLREVAASLGAPGASQRAADEIIELLESPAEATKKAGAGKTAAGE